MDSVVIEKIYPGEPDPHGLTKNWISKADDPCVNIYEQTLLERATDLLAIGKKKSRPILSSSYGASMPRMYEEMKTGQQAEKSEGTGVR